MSCAVIAVSQDCEGLQMAAFDLFERSMSADGLERAITNASLLGDLQELERIMPERKYSPGYLSFLCYLLWLGKMMDVGVQFLLFADEAEGLRAVNLARQEFEHEHPACCACGTPQATRFAKSCSACGQKFR